MRQSQISTWICECISTPLHNYLNCIEYLWHHIDVIITDSIWLTRSVCKLHIPRFSKIGIQLKEYTLKYIVYLTSIWPKCKFPFFAIIEFICNRNVSFTTKLAQFCSIGKCKSVERIDTNLSILGFQRLLSVFELTELSWKNKIRGLLKFSIF